jgi:hypothetical protein
MDKVKKILYYWRNSLADSNRMSIQEARLQKAHYIDTSFEEGVLPPKVVKELFDEKEELLKKHRKHTGLEEEVAISRVEILISPIRLIKRLEHGKRKFNGKNETVIHLMWIPASVDAGGKLSPNQDLTPWIIRDVLEPVRENTNSRWRSVTIGTVEAVDEFMTRLDPPEKGWKELTKYCCDLFKSVSEKEMTAFSIEGFLSDFTLTVLLDMSSGDSTDGIIQLYDQIIDNRETPSLLRNYASISNPPLNDIETPDRYIWSSSLHIGQMGNEYPLSQSQRQALYHFHKISGGEMIAVNGPPGTGKTTLLQSVVANAVVDSALKGESPSIIAVSSTNNQAVENIIESFRNVKTKTGPLAQRWLPEIKSYALFLPASTREIDQNIHYTRYNGEGLPNKIEDLSYCEKAKK